MDQIMTINAYQFLKTIPFQINMEKLFDLLCIKKKDPYADRLIILAGIAQEIARPKALYRLCRLEKQTVDAVIVEGTILSSRVLRVNLDPVHRVFVGLSTCGSEILELANSATNFMEKYWVDVIMEMALRAADQAMDAHIQLIYQPGPLSSICPGSIADWPITEQKPIFNIIGRQAGEIGVTLSESMLMEPIKSLSRIIYPSKSQFKSCQLCPIERCASRKALYDPKAMASRYAVKDKEVSSASI